MSDCGMLEFPCTWNLLSWVGKIGRTHVRCRLDQALGNKIWHHKYPHSSVQYLRMWVWPSTCSGKCWGWGWSCESDHQHPHILMWVWPSNIIIISPIKVKKTFIFDKCWLDNEDIKRIFTDGWNYTYLPQNTTIMDQVFSCRRAWVNEYENVQNSEKQVEEFKEKVDNLYSSDWVDMPQQWALRRLWKYWLCFKI